MILGHSSPLNIFSFAAATWGMFATESKRTSLLLTLVAVLLQRAELQLEINCPFLRGGTEFTSSARAADTEGQPGNEAGKLPEGTWVTESSKNQFEVFTWAGNWYMELAMKEWEKMEVKLFTVSLNMKDRKWLERVTYYFQNNTWSNWTIKKDIWRLDLDRTRL